MVDQGTTASQIENRIDELKDEPVEAQVKGIEKVKEEIETVGQDEINDVADSLLQIDWAQLHDRVSTRCPEILATAVDAGGGDHFIEVAISQRGDSISKMALDGLEEAKFDDSDKIEQLIHCYIENSDPSFGKFDKLLHRVDGEEIEFIGLSPYNESQKVSRALHIVQELGSIEPEDDLVKIYEFAIDKRFAKDNPTIQQEIEEYFTSNRNDSIVPKLEKTLETDSCTRETVNALAEQGSDQLDTLLVAYQEGYVNERYTLRAIDSIEDKEFKKADGPVKLLDEVLLKSEQGRISYRDELETLLSKGGFRLVQKLTTLYRTDDIDRQLARETLRNLWEESIPTLLDHLEEESSDAVIRRLQRPFEELPVDGVELLFEELLTRESLTQAQREALIEGIIKHDSEAKSHVNQQLLESIEQNIGNRPQFRRLCICYDRLRFENRIEPFESTVAVAPRRSMHILTSGLREIIRNWHSENRLSSIIDLLVSFETLDSLVYEDITGALSEEIMTDIREYRDEIQEAETPGNLKKDTKEKLRERENIHLEFTEKGANKAKLTEEVESFLNTEGGVLFIGVGDDGTPKGIKGSDWDVNEPAEKVQRILRSRIRPQPVVTTHRIELNGKELLRVDVPSGNLKPYFFRQEGEDEENRIKIRIGSSAVSPSRQSIINLVQQNQYYSN